ncbi:ATP synthase subunit I [Pseudogracilibacillus auburnensis]|uniref:ATP synthase subunit I n=1 Tax=Pseudogracilibacillus auburnensis TaxID=1494959 RepID=UPI001A965755|nr:ATP synthase subunit I [Pseudogracilibacillus auburnensis]MBO1004255.1 ATP synthase subunit I [Pseudogracilibacillus auburnensis]
MSNYRSMANRQRKWMLIIIAIVAIGVGVLPNKHFFLGLLLGTGISFYNLWLLQRKTNLLGESAERSGKRKGIGTISRLAAAALGVLVAIRYDLSIVGFIIGLMTAYPVIMIDFIWFNRK